MSTVKRSISLLLAMIVLVGVFTPAAQAAPVEETASVNTDNMTIEGTNGFGNLLSQEITESQEESEAADTEYPGGYSVTDLVIEGNTAKVTYDTMENATLVVALYTEDGRQMLTSTTATVTPDATEAELLFEGNMPEYFMASAYLLDQYDYSPLCAPYDTPMYTQEMQELLASTVDDYDPGKILNLDDDDTTNFAVYSDSTIIIEPIAGKNIVTAIDDENSTYVIKNIDEQIASLTVGSVFVYPYAENEILIVKVGNISVKDAIATIKGTDIELEEVFSHMKIQGTGSTQDMIVDEYSNDACVTYNGKKPVSTIYTSAKADDAEAEVSISFNVEKEIDEFASVSGSIGIQVDVELEYYICWTQIFIRLEYGAENALNLEYTIKENAPIPKATSKLELNSFGYCLAPGVYIGFEPEVVVEFTTSLSFMCTYRISGGFVFEDGKKDNLTKKPIVDIDVVLEGTIFFGIDLGPHIAIMSGNVAKIKLSSQVGFELTGKITGSHYEDIIVSGNQPEQLHDCEKCLSLEFAGKGDFSLKIELLKCDWLTFEVELAMKRYKLGVAYYSWTYSDLGWGECPHILHKATVTVMDNFLQGIPNIVVTDSNGDTWGITNENGAFVKYLPEGKYTLQAVVDDKTLTKTVEIDGTMLITLNVMHDEVGGYKGIINCQLADSVVDYGSIKASGYYGNNIRWTLYSGGTLTIEGQGKMDHAFLNGVPWADYRSLIKEIVIYDGVTDIGGSVFQFCENLYSVKIPDSVTEIGSYAFRNCTSLKSITIPDSVTNTWGYIFQDCTSLSDVTIGNGLTDIYDGMFQNCNSLTSIEIPDSVTSIGKLAFYECDNLSRVTIGKSVNYMGENSFTWCTKLRTIIFKGNAPTFYSGLFYHVTATAYYPANNSTWTSSVRRDYDGKITWKPYNSLADIPLSAKPISAVELSSNEAITGIDPLAVYPGDYSTKVTKDYILKTASFSNLVPNQQYVLFSMIDVSTQDPLVPSNLLYVDQAVAEADGTLTFDYVQREVHDVSYVFVCGASNKDLKNAEISFPEMSADGALQVVNPTIIYDGKLLIEGQDYVVVGTVDFSEAGEYTCYIRGIRNYTGFVECDYTVIGHSHSFTNFISDENASCTNDGTMTAKCDSCDAIKTIVDEGSALGHSFGDWIVIQEPTTLKDGLEERSCVRCEHTEQRTINKLENPFNDVEPGSFYYEPVMWAVENGVTAGTSATTFDPSGLCLRAHVVTFLYRAAGSPAPNSTKNPFKDVKSGDFYYNPVLWAVENGITQGISKTQFGSTQVCNRAAVVTFLWRAFGSPEPKSTNNPFVDVKNTDFFYKPVLWAVENGITAGIDATHFNPAGACNRAQVVTFLYRAYN